MGETVLLIDIGNTRTKVASANDLTILLSVEEMVAKIRTKQITPSKVVIAQTGEDREDIVPMLRSRGVELIFADKNSAIPFQSVYDRNKLGQDRLATLLGAWKAFHNDTVLVFDSGTCLTIDVLHKDHGHLGGVISPGLQMRLKAMHTFTNGLPLYTLEDKFSFDLGTTTQEAMTAGASRGMEAEIAYWIEGFLKEYPAGLCVMTGGDARYFEMQLDYSIFVRQNLVMEGLSVLAEHHEKK